MLKRVVTAIIFLVLVTATPALSQGTGPFPLDTIVVRVGGRTVDNVAALTRSVEVITRDRIERLGGTLMDVLGRALHVDVLPRSPAQADVAVRGAAFEQVLVLVDGVRVSDQQTGHFDLDLGVPLEMVEQIEILRGPGSTLYGPDAVGGVINIVTRASGATRFTAEGGSFGTAGVGAALASGTGERAIGLGADYRRSDGHRSGTDFRITQARLAMGLPAGSGTVRANVGAGARDFGAADFYAPYESYEETRAFTADVRWEPASAAGIALEPATSFRFHRDDFILIREDPAVYRNMHDSYQASAEMVAHKQGVGPFTLALGAEGNGSWLESNALGSRRELRAATFAEATVGSMGRALLNAGLRVDWHSEYSSFVSPSVAASVAVSEQVRLRASGTRGFRAPSWTERYYVDPGNIGDPDLKPEQFWAAEIGVGAYLPGQLYLDAAAFVRDADELIDWARPLGDEEGPFRTMNVENATFRGLEATLSRHWSGIEVQARAMTLGFEDDPAEGYTGKYALSPLTENVGLNLSVPLTSAFRVTVDGSRARRRGQDVYFRADARALYEFGRSTLFIDLLNFTDAEYLDGSAKPVAGAALYVGVRWTGR